MKPISNHDLENDDAESGDIYVSRGGPHASRDYALLAFAEDRLSESRANVVRAHLRSCSFCARRIASMRLLSNLGDEARDQTPPPVEFERISRALESTIEELTQANEAAHAAGTSAARPRTENGRGIRIALGVGALAAAAVAAMVVRNFQHAQGNGPAYVAEGKSGPVAAALPHEERTHLSWIVTSVSGEPAWVTSEPGAGAAAAAQAALGVPYPNGTALVTHSGNAHVRVGPQTGFVLGERTQVSVKDAFTEPTSAAQDEVARIIRLQLTAGSVTSKVAALRPIDRYEVIAGDTTVHVRGTHFQVRRDESSLHVSVVEGAVDIEGPTGVIHVVAPGAWSTRTGPTVLAANVTLPYPAGIDGEPLATLDLSRIPRMRSWDLRVPSLSAVPPIELMGDAKAQVPCGPVRLRGVDIRGHVFTADLTITQSGLVVEPAQLRSVTPVFRSGTIDTAAVLATMQRGKGELTRCYNQALLRNPQLNPRMRVRVRIDLTGEVTDLTPVGDAQENAAFATCVATRIRAWRFPIPVGGPATVELPLTFRAN